MDSLEEFWWRPEILTATLLGAALGSVPGSDSVSEPGSLHFVAWVLGLFGRSRVAPGAAVYAAALDSQERAGAYAALSAVSGPSLAEELESSSLTTLRGNFLGKYVSQRDVKALTRQTSSTEHLANREDMTLSVAQLQH